MNEEKCRRIAKWIEPKPDGRDTAQSGAWQSIYTERVVGSGFAAKGDPYWVYEPKDFYTDEAANALVLEKLSKTHLHHDFYFSLMWGGEWWRAAKMRDYHDGNADMPVKELSAYHLDRKTAIAEAALLLIERNNG